MTLSATDFAAAAEPSPAAAAPQSVLSESQLAVVRASMIQMRDQATKLMPFAFFFPDKKSSMESRLPGGESGKTSATPYPDNAETLKLLELMNENAKQLLQNKVFVQNPMAHVTLEIMARNLEESLTNFKRNRIELSRDLLRASFHACLNCHASGLSRNQFSAAVLTQGLDTTRPKSALQNGTNSVFSIDHLSPLNKAEMYFVLRDFEKSMQILSTDIADSKRSNNDLLEEMELYLSAAILIQTPSEKLSATLENWAKLANLPGSVSSEIKMWQKSVKTWNSKLPAHQSLLKNLGKPGGDPKKSTATPNDRAASFLNLVALDIGEESNLVDHLYAKLLLIQIVSEATLSMPNRARALQLLGLIYKANDKILFLGLGDAYFASCIDLVPHSPTAEGCFKSLKASIEEANTGSMGTRMDNEDTLYLARMKAKAATK
jgi:hypothetical protein